MSDVYSKMEKEFEEWGRDALGVLQRVQHLLDDGNINNVPDSLFEPSSEDDTVKMLFESSTLTV